MATYAQIASLRESGNIQSRVKVAVVKAAVDILAEDVGTTNHANRVIWAKAALADCAPKVEQMLWHIALNASIQSSGEGCSDNDLQFVVNGMIDTYATGA